MRRSHVPYMHAHRGRSHECSCNSSMRARRQSRLCELKFFDFMNEGEVVEVALSLWAHRPTEEPLSILDRAMGQFEPHDLDFAFDADQLRPPHPFAELIRLAFAPLTAGTPILTPCKADASYLIPEWAPEAMHGEWQRIIMCFADRYGLWLPLEQGDDESSNPM